MSGPIYVSRLHGLPLTDADGMVFGRIDDVVAGPAGPDEAPPIHGFVASVQRRQIFVGPGRVAEIGPSGVRLNTAAIDLRRFRLRSGERLLRQRVIGQSLGSERVTDVAIEPAPTARSWAVSSVLVGSGGWLRRRSAGRAVRWGEARTLFEATHDVRQVIALRQLHPADIAERIAALSPERRRSLALALDDQHLADVLQEMPEDEQRRLIESLDRDRAVHVIEEMDSDDAADLLAELNAADREELLDAMEPGEADDLRRLLTYKPNTAGGIMTVDALVVEPDTTVAEALARLRNPDISAALAAHVFVAEAPTQTPTGRYLGPVGFQRLLRERPASMVGRCLDDEPEPVSPDLPEAEVARRLAAYDAVAVPVVDSAGRLLGAVTVDDVLDHVLPEGWRRR